MLNALSKVNARATATLHMHANACTVTAMQVNICFDGWGKGVTDKG